jgi:hypothetical protein
MPNGFEPQFTITAAVRPDGNGEAGNVAVTVVGTVLTDDTALAIAQEAADLYNLSESGKTKVIPIPGGDSNFDEIIKNRGYMKIEELTTTLMFEAWFPNFEDEDE